MFQIDNLQFKRGGAAWNDARVEKHGAITLDYETRTLRIHDGVTPGGLFKIKQPGLYDEITAEFIVATDTFAVEPGQTTFTLTNVSLDNVQRVRVKVNGVLTANWQQVSPTVIMINDPIMGGDAVVVQQYRTLDDVVLEHFSTTDISSVVRNAIEQLGFTPYPTTHVLTEHDRINLGAVNAAYDPGELDPSVPNEALTVFDGVDFGAVS